MNGTSRPRGAGQPLGTAVKADFPPGAEATLGVIGKLDTSVAGNIVIPVGRTLRPHEGSGWTRTEHVVLTPGEVDQLIGELTELRKKGQNHG